MTEFASLIDRWNARRAEPGLIESLRADPATRVLVMHEGHARIEDDRLLFVSPAEVPDAIAWALLGVGGSGIPTLLAVVASRPEHPRWRDMRTGGAALDAEHAEFLLMGAMLSHWITGAGFCPRCGGGAQLIQAGWARRCSGCGAEHFPRADPAAIVAIESPDGQRLLLGANVLWKGTMFSCFAGFAEAGESLEEAVHREIAEEAGVRLRDVRFIASQPWPYPHSLMVGFRATAIDEAEAEADGEEIIQVRWFTRAEIASALAGEGPVGLPGPASIARTLIAGWLAGQ